MNCAKITLANNVSESLRATIPNNVVSYLALESGDVIEWETFLHNGKKYARIRSCNNTNYLFFIIFFNSAISAITSSNSLFFNLENFDFLRSLFSSFIVKDVNSIKIII
jgi:hypothetical protein